MMIVGDQEKYQRHREARATQTGGLGAFVEVGYAILLFGSVGAITWAIRGSAEWGPIYGTIVPGMTWGLFWYYLCHRKGIDGKSISLWLGLGIAIGGELGYGQYVSWIQGKFYAGDEILPISPWTGYLWFFITGIGWGAPGGIALGWALSGKNTFGRWIARILIPACIGYCGWLLVQTCPWMFFPKYALGIYTGELDHHLSRTVYTNTQNFIVVAWWFGAMLVAVFQRDRSTLTAGSLIGGGFGIGFLQSALWCHGYSYAPGYIDWWKVWELNAGFNLGGLYVLVLYWAIKQVDKNHSTDGVGIGLAEKRSIKSYRLSNLCLAATVFLLLYYTLHGMSARLGSFLGFYATQATDHYAWPLARFWVFIPFAIVVFGATICNLWKILRSSDASAQRNFGSYRLKERMADLITGMGVVGAVSMWPHKIGVLYALFVFLAIFAYNRINVLFENIDSSD